MDSSDYIEYFNKNLEEEIKLRKWQKVSFDLIDEYLKNSEITGIKSPTGSGKSFFGLLLSYRKLSGNNVLIATWTYQLADKIQNSAISLGIPTVIFGGKSNLPKEVREDRIYQYKTRQAIGITTFQSLLTVTDIPNPQILIIDDADLFLEQLNTHFEYSIHKKDFPSIFSSLVEIFTKNIYTEVEGKYKLAYFTDYEEILEVISEVLTQFKSDTDYDTLRGLDRSKKDLFWQIHRHGIPKNGNLILFSDNKIILKPYVPPSDDIEILRETENIVMMSATLGNIERLKWEIGSTSKSIDILNEEVITSHKISSKEFYIGSRLIFPINEIDQSLDLELPDENENIRKLIGIISISQDYDRILVICNTLDTRNYITLTLNQYFEDREAKNFHNQDDIDWLSEVEKGILVSGGQYFGIDLPEDACNCVIITDLPFTIDVRDYLELQILQNQSYQLERVSRRFTQAVGRTNRTKNDRSVIFVFDENLSKEIRTESTWAGYLPELIISEIIYTIDKMNPSLKLSDALQVASSFLNDEYVDFLDEQRDIIKEKVPFMKVDEEIALFSGLNEEIEGWNNLYYLDYEEASINFEHSFNKIFRDTKSHTELGIESRKAFNLYMVALSKYLSYIANEEIFEIDEIKQLLTQAHATTDIIWFKKLAQLPLIKKQIQSISPEENKLEFFGSAEDYIPNVIWNNAAFDHELKDQFEKAFKAITPGALEPAGERIFTLIERVLKKVILYLSEEYDYDLPDNLEDFSIINYLNWLMDKNILGKDTQDKWLRETSSPGRIRTDIVHQKYDVDTIALFMENLAYVRNGLKSIFWDLQEYVYLENNLDQEKIINELNKLGRNFKRMTSPMKIDYIFEDRVKNPNNWITEKNEETAEILSMQFNLTHARTSISINF